MKPLSIKMKVVFWYAFSMFVVTALLFAFLLIAGNHIARKDARDGLTITTDMAVSNVIVTGGHLVIDDDIIYYMDQTWIVIAKDDGMILSGLMPDGFPEDVPFEEDRIRQAGEGVHAFYVYDRLIENQKTGKIWVRGMTPIHLSVRDPAFHRIVQLFMIIIPVLVLLSLAGGWLITRRAFLPLRRINETVAMIQEGDDLSRRVSSGIADPGDEIENTAIAFDKMLDRIGESFEREKQFTNDAGHELRTPTAVIQAQCEYIMDNIDDQDEVKESVKIIHNQALKMSTLIEQLLMLARADRYALKLNRRKTDISLLAEETAFIMAGEASKKSITIQVDAPEGVYARVDEHLMSRVFENLVSNALKYGKSGGHVMITVREIRSSEAADETGHVQIGVLDDGIGISEDEINKIWKRFYRINPTGKTEGLGLGLPLVKAIIEAHGGSIVVNSQQGFFTEFIVLI